MVSPIYQCTAGHIYCAACEPKLESCPTCRVVLVKQDPIRNRALEALSEQVEEECRFGCGSLVKRVDKRRHEEIDCVRRPYRCPWPTELGGRCNFQSVRSSDLASHLTLVHVEEERRCRMDVLKTQARTAVEHKEYDEVERLVTILAEDFNNVQGLMELGWMYADANGLGLVARNVNKAISCYAKAAVCKDADAMARLGILFSELKEEAKAVEWYEKAVQHGSLPALNNLAKMYYYGRGVAKDEKKAFEFFKRALDQSKNEGKIAISALNNLAFIYLEGKGVERNEEKAFEFFQQAADRNCVTSMFLLGTMHAQGAGVTKDEKKALELFRQVAKHKDIDVPLLRTVESRITLLESK